MALLAGAICIPLLPIARYPQLAPPSVSITAFYTGANAQAVESAVTTPLEQVVNGVEGMTYMQSSSTNSGVSTINVYFDIGRDPDLAAVDVQNRVNQTLGRLPADVRTTGVTVTKNSSGFMGGLGFFSRDNRYTAQSSALPGLFVRTHQRVPGVGTSYLAANTRCPLARPRPPGRPRHHRRRRGHACASRPSVAAGALETRLPTQADYTLLPRRGPPDEAASSRRGAGGPAPPFRGIRPRGAGGTYSATCSSSG